jgi:hypothetical protein
VIDENANGNYSYTAKNRMDEAEEDRRKDELEYEAGMGLFPFSVKRRTYLIISPKVSRKA